MSRLLDRVALLLGRLCQRHEDETRTEGRREREKGTADVVEAEPRVGMRRGFDA